MNIGFDNSSGTLQFVFPADELREAQKILDLFGWQGDAEVDEILTLVEAWAESMEKMQ